MLKSLEDVTTTQKRLKIEIPVEIIESEIKKTLIDAQKRARIPGFRAGKTPMYLIEKKFGKDAEAEVLEKLIPEFYMKAVKEADIKPISSPVIEESYDFKRNEPFSMTIAVEVRPRVENLNYEGLTVREVTVDVTADEVDSILQRLAEERATYESVDVAAAPGDLITIDYIVKDEDISANDVVLKIGSGPYPQEFFDAIIGKKKDEEFTVEASFPENLQTQFAGKRSIFELKIKDIKRRNTPAIDDEFAKDMGIENISSLKDRVRENILASKNIEASRTKQKEILDKLIESHSFDLPESLLNAQINRMISEVRAASNDSRTDEEIKEEIRPHAEKSVKASILIELIGEKEGITVSEEEIKEDILRTAQMSYTSPENIMKYYIARDGSLEGLKQSVFEKKVLRFLLDKAKVEK